MISQIVRANPYGWVVGAVTFLILGLLTTRGREIWRDKAVGGEARTGRTQP